MSAAVLQWWQAWGQSGTALGLSMISLALGVYNAVQARQRHRWEKADRDRDDARRAWCEEERRKLVERIGTSHPVPPDKTDWARWGEDEGYFRVQPGGPGGALVLVLAAHRR